MSSPSHANPESTRAKTQTSRGWIIGFVLVEAAVLGFVVFHVVTRR